MKRIIPPFLWLLCPLLALAQASEGTRLLQPLMSLMDCIEYAQEHSPLLLPLESRIELLDLNHRSAKESFMPSLNASAGENVSFGRSQGVDGVYRDINSANTSFQIGTQLSLFEGGRRWYQLKKTEKALESSGYILDETLDKIALQVAQSYITYLLSVQIAEIAEENLMLSTRLLSDVRSQVEVGKMARSKEIEMESQVGQDELRVSETKADVERAKRTLLLDMGVRDFEQVEQIDFKKVAPEEVVRRLSGTDAFRKNPDWTLPTTALMEHDLSLAQYDVKIARSAYLPSLSLSAGYSNGYYYNFGDAFQGTNASFADQINHNGRTFVGLSLSIPIYSRGQVRQQVRQAQLQESNLRSQLLQQYFNDSRNITLAETDLRKSEEQYRIAEKNVALTTHALDMAEKEYQAGRITTYDWDQAKNKRANALATYMQAIYNRLWRTINLTYFNSGTIPLTLAD